MADASPSTPPPVTGGSSDTGLPSNVAAGLCAIFTLIGGLIFYLIEKKDQFVRHWAVQAMFFGGAWLVLSLAVSVLGAIFGSIPGFRLLFLPIFGLLHFAVWLGGVILWIMGIVKAFQGQKWEYPYVSAQCKKWFPTLS
jgi:uncharacterized membrane protein